MLSFFAAGFAVAGAVAAAGPLVIHLLNRRRFRQVQWAAMDFLREAMRQNKRMLEFRDLILLLLRTACVALFGLAMARPYLSQSSGETGVDQPVHAVLLLDNSLSMGYETTGGTLLDQAKDRARDYVERLPAGSRVTIVPLCAARADFALDPYRTREDALEALDRVGVIDRAADVSAAFDVAAEACRRSPDMPEKRVVLIGDQQETTWPTGSLAERLKQLPELQVAQVGKSAALNTWVADLRLQDGIADVETPTAFLASIRHAGDAPRRAVPVSLRIDGVKVAVQTVDLDPGQARELRFPYAFHVAAEPGRPVFVSAEVSVPTDPSDRLPQDNARVLVVPVVAELPVVFADQLGPDEEDPGRNRYGETFRLRRLLAPVLRDSPGQPIRVRHLKFSELDKRQVQDARLVVVAGVERPDPQIVELLADYVKQGGRLVLAAGAGFDPRAWQATAWLDGQGILPLPLKPEAIGQLPEESSAATVTAFRLDPRSMIHDWFLIDDEGRDELYAAPVFFKGVQADSSPAVLEKLVADETGRVVAERAFLTAHRDRQRQLERLRQDDPARAALVTALADDEKKLTKLKPDWLAWRFDRQVESREPSPEELALRRRPSVLATWDNGLPFLIDREIGLGRVVFVASGVQSQWNTLTDMRAVLVFDRIFRALLEQTLPQRNYTSDDPIRLPIEPGDRRGRLTLTRPDGTTDPLTVDALGGDVYGITVRGVSARGVYRIAAYQEQAGPGATLVSNPTTGGAADGSASGEGAASGLGAKLWEVPLSVNGPERESHLETIDELGARRRLGETGFRWIGEGEPISLEAARVRGQDWWKVAMALVFVGLLAETTILAWPALKQRFAPTPAADPAATTTGGTTNGSTAATAATTSGSKA